MLVAGKQVFAEEEVSPANPPPSSPSIKDLIRGWSFTPGVGVRVVSLDVTRKSDGYTGTLTNDGSFTDPLYVSFNIETPGWMISDRIGLSIRNHSQTFDVSRQQVHSSTTQNGYDYADLGTSARGYYSYIGPTIFYRTTDGNGDTRVGAGYGYWKAWFHGDIILARDGAAARGMPRTSIDGSMDGDTGPMFFLQMRGGKYTFEIAISRVTFSKPDYETTLQELGMSLGYIVAF